MDERTVVDQIAGKVADAPYELGGRVQDMNRDGVITHRDNYLRDFEQYVKPKLEPRASQTSPDDPKHQDHAMLEQIRAGVGKIDSSVGKTYDDVSERMSRCLLPQCKAEGLRQVDHVVTGGKNLFAVEGGLTDPAHRRAHVSTDEAIRTPVEQSDERLMAVNKNIAEQQALARQQELTRGPDDPSRGGPTR